MTQDRLVEGAAMMDRMMGWMHGWGLLVVVLLVAILIIVVVQLSSGRRS